MQEILSESREPFEPAEPAVPNDPVEPSPNDPPWSSGIAIAFWILSVLLIVAVPAIFIAPYALSLGTDGLDSDSLVKTLSTDPVAIAIQIIAIIPAHLLTLLFAWYLVTNGRRYSFFKTLGWSGGGMLWWHYLVIMGAFFVLMMIVGALLPEQENELMRILRSSRYAVFLVAFMATFTAPLVEEVIYRGVLYSALQRTVGVSYAVVLVTFLFALVHLPQYYPSVSTMILLTLLSLILTVIRVKTGNLLPCVILHTIFNAFQSILLVAEPYFGIGSKAEEVVSAITSLTN